MLLSILFQELSAFSDLVDQFIVLQELGVSVCENPKTFVDGIRRSRVEKDSSGLQSSKRWFAKQQSPVCKVANAGLQSTKVLVN